MEEVLIVKNLTKNYRNIKALQGVSFSLAKGEILGLLGPNGAGKTTTIQMLLGLLTPSSGEIIINGQPLATNRTAAASAMNFVATYAGLPSNLSVAENLKFFARLYSVKNRKEKITEVLAQFQLSTMAKKRTGLLSSGEQTRLNLAKAFLSSPRLLLLDEPTASLDPDTADRMRQEIKNLARQAGAAVLWTSHNMFEMEKMCDRIVFLSKGTVLSQGTPQELVKNFGHGNLEETFIALSRKQAAGGQK